MKWAQKQKGFTIVELLVVVVVIAILASVTIVAYNGVVARANDTAVKSDLRTLHEQVEIFHINKGTYPSLAQFTSNDPAVMQVRVAKGSYAAGDSFMYCVSGDNNAFALIARSKSGILFYSSSNQSTVTEASFTFSDYTDCASAGVTPTPAGVWVRSARYGWASWVNG